MNSRAPRTWSIAIHPPSGRSQPAAARPMGTQRISAARNKLCRRRGRAHGDGMATHVSLCHPQRRATLRKNATRSASQRASTTGLADSCTCSGAGELGLGRGRQAWHRGANADALCRAGRVGDERRRCAPGAAPSRPRPAFWSSALARWSCTGSPRPQSLPPAAWLSTSLQQTDSPLAAWPAVVRLVGFRPVAFWPQASWPEFSWAADSWPPASRRPTSLALTSVRLQAWSHRCLERRGSLATRGPPRGTWQHSGNRAGPCGQPGQQELRADTRGGVFRWVQRAVLDPETSH